jgi:hypothetical protein
MTTGARSPGASLAVRGYRSCTTPAMTVVTILRTAPASGGTPSACEHQVPGPVGIGRDAAHVGIGRDAAHVGIGRDAAHVGIGRDAAHVPLGGEVGGDHGRGVGQVLGDAGSLDEQAAAAVQRAGQGRRRGRARPSSAPAKLMSPGPIRSPASASISAKPARLPSSSNPAAVTSPEVSLVTKTASRIRLTFLPAQVGELGKRFRRSRSHPGTRRRDIQRSHGHGVASFGQRYKSSGSRGDDGLTNTKKHHGATSWCHLLPCWAHEKNFIHPGSSRGRRASLLNHSLRHGTGRGSSGLQRQALEPAADPALCGGMALNSGEVSYGERGAASKNQDSFKALLIGA